MAILSISAVSNKLEVMSGKPFRIDASINGASTKQEKQISWHVDSGPAVSKGNGLFQAEKVGSKKNVKIIAFSSRDKSISMNFEVSILLPKPEIQPSAKVKCISNSEIQFTADSGGLTARNRWEIVGENFQTGSINKDGLYLSPESIIKKKTVGIKVTDQITGKTDKVTIQLLPVQLFIGKQPEVFAGSTNIRLNISSRNDPEGLMNFTCKILSLKNGSIEDGGIYTPPSSLKAEKEILIEVQSKLNKSIKKTFKLHVGLARCIHCQSDITSNDNFCPDCNEPVGFANIFKQILRENGRL